MVFSLVSPLLTCRLLRLHRWSGRELLQRRLLQYMVPLQSEHLHPLLGHGEPSHGGRCLPVQLRLLLALAGFGVRLSSGWVRRMDLIVECYPVNGKICSGHGICMVDTSIDAPRCFCNSNNKGVDCSKGVGLSMTEIFMIVDIAAVVIVVFTM